MSRIIKIILIPYFLYLTINDRNVKLYFKCDINCKWSLFKLTFIDFWKDFK